MTTQPGLDGRHRDKNGEISRKHGNTRVSTLRRIYGASFAKDFLPDDKLSDVLQKMDEPSLTKLVRHHSKTALEDRIEIAERAIKDEAARGG